jgi:hypothetical protein
MQVQMQLRFSYDTDTDSIMARQGKGDYLCIRWQMQLQTQKLISLLIGSVDQ